MHVARVAISARVSDQRYVLTWTVLGRSVGRPLNGYQLSIGQVTASIRRDVQVYVRTYVRGRTNELLDPRLTGGAFSLDIVHRQGADKRTQQIHFLRFTYKFVQRFEFSIVVQKELNVTASQSYVSDKRMWKTKRDTHTQIDTSSCF